MVASVCPVSSVDAGDVEMRPGEVFGEMLFERGIGEPWIGGRPPWENDYSTSHTQPTLYLPIPGNVARGLHYYPMGTVYSNGYLVLGEGFGSARVPYPAGTYRLFGCYDVDERLVGLYVDLGGYYGSGWR